MLCCPLVGKASIKIALKSVCQFKKKKDLTDPKSQVKCYHTPTANVSNVHIESKMSANISDC